MSAGGDNSSSQAASYTVARFPQGIARAAKVGCNSIKLGSDTNVVPKTKLSPKVLSVSLNFPLNPENGAIFKTKSDDNLKGNLTFLGRSTSNGTCVKNSRLGQGKPQNSSPLKPKHKFDLYNLYTKILPTHVGLNSYEHLRLIENSECATVAGQGPRKTPASFVVSHKPIERLQKWIQHQYETRRHHLEERDISRSELIMSSRKSSLIDGNTFMEPQLPGQGPQRRSSLIKIKARRRSSTVVIVPENDDLIKTELPKKSPRTFRWLGFAIRSVVGLLMRMQRWSISKTQQSAYSEFLYILAGAKTHAGQQGHEDEGQSLLFDKSWFSRTRAWSRMPTWAQAVMRLSPDKRHSQDVQHLKQLLGNMRSFRENITDEMRTRLCQVVRYTRCDKGRIVFRQGHVGCDFYFIFSGSVLIQSDLYNDRTGEIETLVENVLRAGESFGEIALLGDGRRTASVICKEPTELCQIDKVTFLTICPNLFSDQLKGRFNFARQFDIFHSWGEDELKQLCFLSQVLNVPHSRIIEKNWATSKFVYFVMKGRASMLKEFDVTAVVEMTGQRLNFGQGSFIESKGTCQQKVKQFALVGVLHSGDCSDLSVLALDPRKDIPKITLVSEGVHLFRVSVRTFLRLAPKITMEEYLKVYKPRRFPSENELLAHYLVDLNWSEFKKNLVHINRLEKAGRVVASIPATLKGTSGWARWPGYALIPKFSKTTISIEAVAAANRSVVDYYRDNDDGNAEIDDGHTRSNDDSTVHQIVHQGNTPAPKAEINVKVRRPVRSRSLKPTSLPAKFSRRMNYSNKTALS